MHFNTKKNLSLQSGITRISDTKYAQGVYFDHIIIKNKKKRKK